VKSLCRRPPIAAQPRRDIGVTGWTCTSYGGVTARGLSASPSATNWYPRQDLHPHDSRHYVLNVACLLIPPRGHRLVKLSGLEPDRICLKGRVREPLCIQLQIRDRVGVALHRPRLRGVLLR
jgi:hypothetical protein